MAHLQTLSGFDTCDPSGLCLSTLAALPSSRAFPAPVSNPSELTEATGLVPSQSFNHIKLYHHLSRVPFTGPSTFTVLSTSLQL